MASSSADYKEKPQECLVNLQELFTLDVKYDSLKAFLDKMVGVINQHAKVLSDIEKNLEGKIDSKQVEQGFVKIEQSLSLYDPELQKLVKDRTTDKLKPENTGNAVDDSVNKLCNKISMLGQACALNYKQNKDVDGKMNKWEEEFPKKVNKDYVKKKVDKLKKKDHDELEDSKKKLNKKIDDVEKKLSGQIAQAEVKTKDIETKTLYKIQDCESLLQKRITNDYVDQACKGLEDKLRKEFSKAGLANSNGLLESIEDMKSKIHSVDEMHNEKNRLLKKLIADLEESLGKKLVSIEKLEDYKKVVNERFTDATRQFRDIEKKLEPEILFSQQYKVNRGIHEKLDELDAIIKSQKLLLEEYTSVRNEEAKKGKDAGYDPHKICALQAEIRRLSEDQLDTKKRLHDINRESKDRYDTLETKLINNLNSIRKEDPRAQIKEEIINLVEKLNAANTEKLRNTTSRVDDLGKKILLISELEKKVNKMMKETDLNPLLRELKGKSDKEDVLKNMMLMDEKIKSLVELINQYRKEFEDMDAFYKHFSHMLNANQAETISTFIGANRITNSRCLSCGLKGKNFKYPGHLMGNDGRIYKADVAGSNIYDGHEVYDIGPNQIDAVLQMTGTGNDFSRSFSTYQNTGSKERPTSAKTDATTTGGYGKSIKTVISSQTLRPSSAQVKK